MTLSRLSIILPAFNEASTIERVLSEVCAQPVCNLERELIVVESNSSDGTRERIRQFMAAHPAHPIVLIEQSRALGKGNAVRAGLARATGDIVLIQDGDLEYDFGDYPALLRPIVEGDASLVLGSRHLSAGSWKIRKFESHPIKAAFINFGGILFHAYFNLLYGQRLTDPTTMFKVFRRTCIENVHLEANRFDFDFELLGKLLRRGYRAFEVPVSYRSRSFKEGKKIRIFRDPFTWLRAITKYRFSRLYTTSPSRALKAHGSLT